MGRIFGMSFVLQLIAATVLAMVIGAEAELSSAALAAGSVGLFWIAPAPGVIDVFERRTLTQWAVNAGYNVVVFVVMGLILALWP